MSELLWDVFISHASEDKMEVAFPLSDMLAAAGLTVWIDEAEIFIGDSLREKIDSGLAQSQFGIVILSHHFFAKDWPKSELDGLFAREIGGEQSRVNRLRGFCLPRRVRFRNAEKEILVVVGGLDDIWHEAFRLMNGDGKSTSPPETPSRHLPKEPKRRNFQKVNCTMALLFSGDILGGKILLPYF